MKKIFFIAFLLLLSSGLFAQSTNTISPMATETRRVSGIIKDINNQAVTGATVLLMSKSDTIKTTTDTSGIFIFDGVKQSTFVIKATNTDYLPIVIRYILNNIAKKLVLSPIILKKAN